MNQQQQPADNGIYYFLGNITSHILHALPLHKELGGTFVVLSEKAKREVEKYQVPVINLDDKPYKWRRFGWRLKPVNHYLEVDASLRKTTDYLNEHARVVLFYELYDFAPAVRLTKPKTVFLTHGNMLKDYMAQNNRLEILRQYDYMAALGPYLKQKFIERDGIPADKLVDIGIARTDELVAARGKVAVPDALVTQLGIDPAKPIVSYLPTFWGASSVYTVGKEIVRDFPGDYTLLCRPHPQTPRKLLREYLAIIQDKPGNVFYVPEGRYTGIGLTEMFQASAAIIGDVSSVMLDAILLEKPLLFAYDITEHQQGQEDYAAIQEVVDYSQQIDMGSVTSLPTLLATALKKGVDQAVWRETETRTFFHADGTSIAAIAAFVRNL